MNEVNSSACFSSLELSLLRVSVPSLSSGSQLELTALSRPGAWWGLCRDIGLAVYLLVLDDILRSSPRPCSLVSLLSCASRPADAPSLLPETLRSLVGDGSIPPPMINCTPMMYRRRRQEKRKAKEEGTECRITDRPPRTPVGSVLSSPALGCEADRTSSDPSHPSFSSSSQISG